MRKIFFTLLLLLALTGTTCFAYEPDPDVWEWVNSTSEVSTYIQTEPIIVREFQNEPRLEFMTLTVIPSENKYVIHNNYCDYVRAYYYATVRVCYFNDEGVVTDTFDPIVTVTRSTGEFDVPHTIHENTTGAKIYAHVCARVGLKPLPL